MPLIFWREYSLECMNCNRSFCIKIWLLFSNIFTIFIILGPITPILVTRGPWTLISCDFYELLCYLFIEYIIKFWLKWGLAARVLDLCRDLSKQFLCKLYDTKNSILQWSFETQFSHIYFFVCLFSLLTKLLEFNCSTVFITQNWEVMFHICSSMTIFSCTTT